ncbi:uncharacterized protein [Dermacentor albipictus]|uniref:uncharacterized protein n=1 Tax=Dermacentor albipictus TaxID=60249 RepID=UPI0038FCBD66
MLTAKDQLLLVLLRLRLGLFERDLAYRFRVSIATLSRIYTTWISFIYLQVGQVDLWLSRDKVDKAMPAIFKERYPSTRTITDATEVRCEVPSSLVLQLATYSTYKSTITMKGLVVISPDGTITFLSKLFTGSVSDKELVEKSGFLKLEFEPGDSVMADKGFKIYDLLSAKGVALNIPHFLRRQHLNEEEVRQTEEIASLLRIHVERRIQRIKAFDIFDRPSPLSITSIINEIWALCAFLSNLQSPLMATLDLQQQQSYCSDVQGVNSRVQSESSQKQECFRPPERLYEKHTRGTSPREAVDYGSAPAEVTARSSV